MAIAKIGVPVSLGEVWTKKDMKELAEQWWYVQVAKLKAGKLIKRKYKPSTVYKRKRFGLQTKHIDLTGSTKYSKKQWRLTEQGIAKATSNKKAVIEWKRKDAETLYGYQVRRFGKIF